MDKPHLLASIEAVRGYDLVVLAPHLDDAALSCGGAIALAVDRGERVVAVTLCAGDPPSGMLSPFAQYLHAAWKLGDEPVTQRRSEDRSALQMLGCDGLHLTELDAPYRLAAYGEGDNWRGAVAADDPLVDTAATLLQTLHRQQPAATILVPLGAGNHVDHQIVAAAALALPDRAEVRWYEDTPYAARDATAVDTRRAAFGIELQPVLTGIDSTIDRKLDAIRCYDSQLHQLFGDESMEGTLRAYSESLTGLPGHYAERSWRR